MEKPVVFRPPNVENPVTDSELNVGSVTSNSVPLISIFSTLRSVTVSAVPTPVLNDNIFSEVLLMLESIAVKLLIRGEN